MGDLVLDALRPLQLPCEPGCEQSIAAAVHDVLTAKEIPVDDHPDEIRLLMEEWLEVGGPPRGLLLACARAAVRAGMPGPEGGRLADKYPRLVTDLEKESIPTPLAVGLIGQAPLAFSLATRDRMSATQVANVLTQALGGTYVPWRATQRLLRILGVQPELDESDVDALAQADGQAANERFADTDLGEAVERIGVAGNQLGFPHDAGALLQTICPSLDPREANAPYLQTIDYQCLIVEFFDHHPAFLYEFVPRGGLALSHFKRFPATLAPAGNPILNNFKAIDAADAAWARSRPAQAHALVDLLQGMARMPFSARREFASWIRQWIRHVAMLADTGVKVFQPGVATKDTVDQAVEIVSRGNTQTFGILEQRFVDAVSSVLHPSSAGWRPRGLGDAVNAANLPRRKLGDADYQDPLGRNVVAYEPHGGRLSRPYLAGHQHSLARVIDARLNEEWLGIADANEWSASVRFVAHDFDLDDLRPIVDTVIGVRVETTFTTFTDLAIEAFATGGSGDTVRRAFGEHFFDALNRRQTPQYVRDTLANDLGVDLKPAIP